MHLQELDIDLHFEEDTGTDIENYLLCVLFE